MCAEPQNEVVFYIQLYERLNIEEIMVVDIHELKM